MAHSIEIYRAEDLDFEYWRELQSLQREAFSSTLRRSQSEIDTLIEWDNFAQYAASHANPNILVGGRYNPNQEYYNPKVAIATENNKAIGFAYSAENVSGGTELERRTKRLSVIKNYLWLREEAVHPDYQRGGLAQDMGKLLLEEAMAYQPVSTYVWPDEINFMEGMLKKYGFAVKGERFVTVFGDDSQPVRQVRMQADSVAAVLKNL